MLQKCYGNAEKSSRSLENMLRSTYDQENFVDIIGVSATTKIIDIIYTGLLEHRMKYPMYGI